MLEWLNEMFRWYNLIFVLAFMAMALYTFVTMVSGIAGGPNMDMNTEHDLSVDADHHVDADHDVEHGGLWGMRGFLGVGKVPMIAVVMSLLGFWGVSGLTINKVLDAEIQANDNWAFVSLAGALMVSLLGTALFSRVLAKIAPTSENYSTQPKDLIGQMVTVLYTVEEASGTIRLTDQYGTLLDLQARAKPGTGPFNAGTTVQIQGVLPGGSFLVGPVHGQG